MTKRMLIDATHKEETRVAVVDGNRLEEYDFENTVRKSYKGNIYLAKVTRVEPSLQAAFVDYGGNRHGFLPFSEIHPDYYRIPIADREALLKRKQEASKKMAEEAEKQALEDLEQEDEAVSDAEDNSTNGSLEPDEDVDDEGGDAAEVALDDDLNDDDLEPASHVDVDVVGGEGVDQEERQELDYLDILKEYKIQEVIKRGQVMLIQVNKEERGTKGAALTSYISLPGRYCVLMPNSPHGGGVSRKVNSVKDRQKLRKILSSLDVEEGMAVIIRTAGMSRTKAEIKRDYDYLMRTWNGIRELTLKSKAPKEVYEEGNLIKRSIRDLYTSDIDEVLVSGDDGYRAAKDFMKTLVPSHAKKVQPYKEEGIPLFFRYKVETQIEEIYNATVQLESGGYIVINPTEALISIDVNSGRATKERHIEETALNTNLESADEIARQLRLRDLGGLIVIDFIDMEERKNNRAVERRLRDAMDMDRARVQLGRISPFGLLEMSRQRLRPSLLETHFEPCVVCDGRGVVRTRETAAIRVLRLIEEEGIRQRSSKLTVEVPPQIALYLLNQKREMLADIEQRYDFKVFLRENEELSVAQLSLERVDAKSGNVVREDIKSPEEEAEKFRGPKDDREQNKKPRKSPAKKSNRTKTQKDKNQKKSHSSEEEKPDKDGEKPKSRRRGRRGGRRRGRRGGDKRQNKTDQTNNDTAVKAVSSDEPSDAVKNDTVRADGSQGVAGAPVQGGNDNNGHENGEKKPKRSGWWNRLKD